MSDQMTCDNKNAPVEKESVREAHQRFAKNFAILCRYRGMRSVFMRDGQRIFQADQARYDRECQNVVDDRRSSFLITRGEYRDAASALAQILQRPVPEFHDSIFRPERRPQIFLLADLAERMVDELEVKASAGRGG